MQNQQTSMPNKRLPMENHQSITEKVLKGVQKGIIENIPCKKRDLEKTYPFSKRKRNWIRLL